MRLLVLSNGHGEDAIALHILQALQRKPNYPEIAALPIVGEGRAYTQHQIPVIGSVRAMPSGGFVYMDGRQLVRDLRGGLLQLTWTQLRAVKRWVNEGNGAKGEGTVKERESGKNQSLKNSSSPPFILAVGDIVPLLFAWLSGAPYAFLGTAKSEYYLRDEAGWLPRKSWWDDRLQRWFGSDYLPWERWLFSRPRCKAVFCRDQLTADTLQKFGIPALHFGNPMMDGLVKVMQLPHSASATSHPLTFVLIPGSRSPEAYENWHLILQVVMELVRAFSDRPLVFLGAIAPGLFLEPLNNGLVEQNWQPKRSEQKSKVDEEKSTSEFTYGNAVLVLTQHAFGECLHRGDLAIAMAGTATEQFVGLGKPAITLPGKGPQFTPAFAEAQTRLLGPSVILVQQPKQVPAIVQTLLNDPDRLHLIAENGHRRMGKPGSSDRIATHLIQHLL